MNLKTLINKSYYGSIGYIKDNTSVDLLGSYLLYNKPVLDEFKDHIFAFTYSELDWPYLKNTIYKLYPNAIILLLNENRGHNFGTADLDNFIFNYCKENNIKWLCKSANDIILTEDVLSIEVSDADFYYLNGIGYGGMVPYDFDFNKIIEKDFYPQTNFYFIDVSKTDYLNNKQYINETYQQVQTIPNYNGKVWEYIKGWSCEDFLKQCIERNNLSKHHLISKEKYLYLLQIIKDNQIHDCSHKNIMIEGICHFQYNNQEIVKI